MHPQHHAQRIRPPTAPGLRVERLDAGLQPLPGNQPVHRLEKDLAPRPTRLQVVLQLRKRRLLHGSHSTPSPRNQCDKTDLFRQSLALTGCRRSEALNLRWRDIGEDAISLRDSKTGARDPDAFLFPRYAEARGKSSLIACWRAVCADAKLGSLRLHDLRHTAASQAVMAGENLPLVGKLLGRRKRRATPILPADIRAEAVDNFGVIIFRVW